MKRSRKRGWRRRCRIGAEKRERGEDERRVVGGRERVEEEEEGEGEKGYHCNFDESLGFNQIVEPRRRRHDSTSLSLCLFLEKLWEKKEEQIYHKYTMSV